MKKLLYLILSFFLLFTLFACDENNTLIFKQNEFILKSGEKVELTENVNCVTFEFVNNDNTNIKIDADSGVITFNPSIPNYSQLMVIAKKGDIVSTPCVVTLYYEYGASEVSFTNRTDYIANNEYVNAISSENYSVRYYLKEEVSGISINQDSGKVSFAPIVNDRQTFTVIADSHDSKCEKEFIYIKNGLVEASVFKQALCKTELTIPAIYPIDFSNSEITKEDGFVTLLNSFNEEIDTKYYKFDKENSQLIIDPTIVNEFDYGSHDLKIVTKRNVVSVELSIVTKFIYTAADLDSIDDSIEALSGYYILMNDIDLTEYLSEDGAGYNDGKGWTPIGSYVDTLDQTVATKNSFKGTFDGNGHVITGFYSNRKDTASFNAGLFGYLTNTSTIKNLGVVGEMNVSSYSGGFVGSNSGVIENCWADVKVEVYSGEGAYRYVGGFVGNNFGTISNCYSIGNVLSDREFGRFAGSNQGLIINCYSHIDKDCSAFVGAGYQAEESVLFNNLDEMKEYDYSNVLDSNNWDCVVGELPLLKQTLKDFNVRNIEISVESKIIYAGNKVYLDCLIYPSNLHDKYINNVSYSVEGEGAFLIGNYIYTDATASKITVTASLTINNVSYTNSMDLTVKTKITSLSLVSDLSEVEVGNSYKLVADFLPLNSDETITYQLSGKYRGVSIDGDILTVDSEYNLTDTITLYAISESGVKSNLITLNVIKHKNVPSGAAVGYLDSEEYLTYTFDEGTNLSNLKVYMFGKEIAHKVMNNTVYVAKSNLTNTKDYKVRLIFKLDNETYAADAYYLSHNKYSLENVGEDVIYINSIEDFFKYFNANPNETWSEEKLNNYNKTYILTADLDFGGMKLYGIGTSDVKFSGKFYGMGHTISNFKIYQNERVNLGQVDSSYYSVGLFASVSTGEFYDVIVKDATVTGKNFVGGLVGMITDGIIENCYGYNLTIEASEYTYSADGIFVGKIIGRNYNGKILVTYYNGLTFNTLG